ncbi:ribbon-helix-helix domain-containing protein [Sphingomonas sp. R647]|uniref:CopG family ribbon-helix-helix protein n=1 Tax=Sphingomonas sp. R647 TaxID=2875233 RepID=UPI001CD523F6|nr:ribbon-helix-helix domain-containing protein [Sphingomonas sp. R647]MCA1199679.1 ribbon-helix-helix domain-containing protein [Sphingomonas sp. R647]
MGAQTRELTAHVPVELADKVDLVAGRLDRSSEWVMQQALSAWVDVEEERHQMTLEAVAEVDAGNTISHAAMLAWAESLGTATPLPLPRSGR